MGDPNAIVDLTRMYAGSPNAVKEWTGEMEEVHKARDAMVRRLQSAPPYKYMPVWVRDDIGLYACVKPRRGMLIREIDTGRVLAIMQVWIWQCMLELCDSGDYNELHVEYKRIRGREACVSFANRAPVSGVESASISTRFLFMGYVDA